MSLINRWEAPTPEFFKKVIKVSIGASVGCIALLNADTIGKAVIPDFHYTLIPIVGTIAKNIIVAGFIAAAVAKFAKDDEPKKRYMKLLPIILAAFILQGCCSEKKALSQVDKADHYFKTPVAKWVRDKYPCVVTGTDTVVLSKDSLVYVECPDLPTIVQYDKETDTIEVTKTIRVPVHLPVRTIYVTNKIEDSAKIFLLNDEIGQLKSELTSAKDINDKLQSKITHKNKWLLWLIIIAVALLGLNYIQFKLRKR